MSKRYQLNKSKYLSSAELMEFNRIIALFKSTDPRDITLLELALKTGARASELLNLEWKDLDKEENTIFIRGLKGSDDREIPIKDELFRRTQSLKKNNSPKRVFNISYPRLVQIWSFYRPVEKKFHSLRHTFALELYKRTRDLRLVQVALGHRNIQNTIVYAEYVYSTQELKKLLL